MSEYIFCVITGVPDNSEDGGNLASAMFALPPKHMNSDLYYGHETYGADYQDVDRTPRPVTFDDMASVPPDDNYGFMVPVFELGEIVILNEPEGREVCGKQRAPRKWRVDVEEFEDLNHAVERSRAVINERDSNDTSS